jgi:hypothetical protein
MLVVLSFQRNQESRIGEMKMSEINSQASICRA